MEFSPISLTFSSTTEVAEECFLFDSGVFTASLYHSSNHLTLDILLNILNIIRAWIPWHCVYSVKSSSMKSDSHLVLKKTKQRQSEEF